MIILFSDDNVLFDTIQVAVDRAVSVRRESDVDRYLSWIEQSVHHPAAVVVDCRPDLETGLEVIDHISSQLRSVPVIAVGESPDAYVADQIGDCGLAGWIKTPFHSRSIREELLQAMGHCDSFAEVHETPAQLRAEIVGGSPQISELRFQVVKAAACRLPVLVAGETGVGKELVARAIHALSESPGRFVTANMAAVVPGLFESELFGSRQGAFTGARDKEGLFQAAKNGTLFLDEITEVALELQPKLLRAVESKEVRPVGSSEAIPVHTRVISATNRDLDMVHRTGRIRLDLWYRLAGLVIRVPPLRQRLEDIPALSQALLVSEGFAEVRLAHSAIQVLGMHSWPGNVRELRSVLARSVVMSGKHRLRGRDIRFE